MTPPPLGEARLAKGAAGAIRTAIALAGGNEVSFVATVDADGIVTTARVVARGDVRSVLALPGVARRGEMLLHNHPSGLLVPSQADLEVAARAFGDGVGFGIVDNEATRVYVVAEVPKGATVQAVDVDDVAALLAPGGLVADAMRAARAGAPYEDRPSQRAMAVEVMALCRANRCMSRMSREAR